MSVGIEIKGTRLAALALEKFPTYAHDEILKALETIRGRLVGAVLASEPDLTGELRSITGGSVYDDGDRMAARVGVRPEDGSTKGEKARQAIKAAALEYGSRGAPVAVQAHTQKLSMAYGRAIPTMDVDVSAYSRTPKIAPRRFLRDPLDAMGADALAEIEQAIERAKGDAGLAT